MKFASLFAGVGGMDLGLEAAGAECVLQVENDKHCVAVLERHWPNVDRIEDVRDVKKLPAVDLVCGGFPCQGLSAAGKRKGLNDERSGLWFEYARLLDVSRPAWCIIENVPGLLSSDGGKDMGIILGTLGELGYGFAYRVLDAQFFGVPQRRKRVFIVGHLGDDRGPGEILLEPEGGEWDPPTRGVAGPATSGAAGARAPLCAETGVVSALAARMGTSGHGDLANAQAGKTHRAASSDDAETWVEADSANTLDAEGNSTRTSHAVAYSVFPKSGHGAEMRAVETDVSGALSATDGKLHDRGTRVASDVGVRRLMPIECERLQGLPDGWTDGHPDTHRYRMLGNAVAVPVVEWIARRLMTVAAGAETKTKPPERRGAGTTKRGRRSAEVVESAAPDVTPRRDEDKPRGHCAKFSDSVIVRAIEIFEKHLKPTARIIDPFAGIGKGVDNLVACGYNALGVELEPEWASQSANVDVGNALSLHFRKNSFDAAFTSPCYGNRMADKDLRASVAGTYAKSLGRVASSKSSCHLQWGPEYRWFHACAWFELARVLREWTPERPERGWFLLNIKDHYRNKQLQLVPEWHVECLESLGFVKELDVEVETPSLRHGANRDRVNERLILFRNVGSTT